MLNIYDLESRWLRYKIKSYAPYVILLISFILLLSVLYFTLDNDNDTPEYHNVDESKTSIHNKQSKSTIESSVPKQKESATRVQIETKIIKEKEITSSDLQLPLIKEESHTHTLTPSLDFMKHMQNSMSPYYEEKTSKNNEKVKPLREKDAKFQSSPQVEKIEEIQLDNGTSDVKEEEETENNLDQKINITRENTQNDISSVIKRFKRNNNPALSLFAAKKYYELGDYQNSYNYALITNEINSEIDASWIVFTKSLVKLGKKDMAIKTLNDYIGHSHSNTAKILLDEIESGKFQ